LNFIQEGVARRAGDGFALLATRCGELLSGERVVRAGGWYPRDSGSCGMSDGAPEVDLRCLWAA
jgi:hypothetical protein